jgi:competence protein ComEC
MPLLWVSLSFLAGVLLAPILGGEPYIWLGLSGGCWLLYWLRHRKTPHRPFYSATIHLLTVSPLILSLAFFLGGFRYHVTRPVLDDHTLATYNDAGRIQLSGKIVRPPDPLDQAILLDVAVDEIIQLQDVTIHLPVQGRCMVRAVPGTKYRYGDRVVFSGRMQTPPQNEDFSYRDYLAIKGIYSYMMYPILDQLTPSDNLSGYALLFAFRERAYQTINHLLPQPEAGLLSGILIGMERDIPEDVQVAFQKTGTSHIVAISGFNIALVSGLLTLFLDRVFGKRWAPLGVIGGIGLYTILVGAQAAVVRAAIMGSICLFGRQIGRRSTGSNTLLFTAALMTWQNPLILGDVGFQLSFSATLGLVLFAGPWQDRLTHWIEKTFSESLAVRLSGPISEFFLFTLAAQLTTLPIILIHFGQFSWSAFLANPLILPAQPWIMMLGGPVILAGMLIPPLGQALIWLVWPLLYYTIHIVEWIAKIPAGTLQVDLSYGLGAILLLFLICITSLLRKKFPKLAIYVRPGMLIFGLVLANSSLWREAVRFPDGKLALIFYPQADCSVLWIESPKGERVLINTGSQVSSLSADLGENLPMLDRSVDILLVPQDKTACFSAAPRLMERIAIQSVLFPPQIPSSRLLSQMDELSLSYGIQSVPSDADLLVDLGNGTNLWVYPSQNGLSLSQVLAWQNFRALFLWDGNLPCSKIEQHASYFNLYFDGRKEPVSLQQECPHLSAGLQVVKKPLARSGSMEVNLTAYKKLTISSDGEQIWISGFRP